MQGKAWMEKGKFGSLFIKSVTPPMVGTNTPITYELGGGEGIRIAVVFQDPYLEQ